MTSLRPSWHPRMPLAGVYLSCHPGKSGPCVCARVSMMKCWNNNSAGVGRRCYRGTKCPRVGKKKKVQRFRDGVGPGRRLSHLLMNISCILSRSAAPGRHQDTEPELNTPPPLSLTPSTSSSYRGRLVFVVVLHVGEKHVCDSLCLSRRLRRLRCADSRSVTLPCEAFLPSGLI